MDIRTGAVLTAVAVFLAGPGAIAAQRQASTATGASGTVRLVAEALRAAPDAPHIDGVLNDAAWASAPVFTGFVQRDPDEGDAGTERTEFRVVYTDDALYVGVRAFDRNAGEIAAILARRDQWSPSDEIAVMIDSYLDRRTGFEFTVNAAGVKRDAYLFDDNNRDDRWDAVWDVATSIDARGWSAEFLIPFNQLRFSRGEITRFGFNVSRRINRLNEVQYWRLIPKDASGWVSLFGDLEGIRDIRPPRRLEILPYTVARAERTPTVAGNPFETGRANTATMGADIKYGVSSALTLTASINPDFGQVEADPAVVNLSAFETFFPEQRPFFNEGLDIFRFRLADGDGDGSQEELFYTRRIGRRPQGRADARGGYAEQIDHTTILGAAKLSGKTRDGWTIGLTGALTDEERAGVVDASGQRFRDVVEPRTGYLVGRLARELRGGQTVLGVFGTTVQRNLPNRLDFLHSAAYTGGFNWTHQFANNSYAFNGRLAGSYVTGSPAAIARTQRASARYFQRPDADYVSFDSTRTALAGYAVAMNFGRTAGDWRWNVGFDTKSPGLEVNDIGFQRQADIVSNWIWINRRWLQPGTVFRRFNVNLNAWSGWNYGGERLYSGGNVNANFTLRNYWNGYFGFNRNIGGLSSSQLRGGPSLKQPGANNGWFGFQSDGRKNFRAGAGGWFFVQDDNDSWASGVNANLSWRPVSNIDVTASPNLNLNRDQWQYLRTPTVNGQPAYIFGELRQTTTAMTFRSNLTFSPTLSLQVYAQPFVSSGDYVGFKQVADPRADRFADRFEELDGNQVSTDAQGNVALDVTGDGTTDVNLGNPDFTFLSFRSNVVLRWEYKLGSTIFFVWQHGRNGFSRDGSFRFGRNLGKLFEADAENVVLLKINYWLSP